jgi:hypothetical protein
MIGYFLGSLRELDVPATPGFRLLDAATGIQVFPATLGNTVTLSARPDAIGRWDTGQEQYQKVMEADFSSFDTPGDYVLEVPGITGLLSRCL